MNKYLIIALAVAVVGVVGVLGYRLFLSGPEDTWLCEGGGWVKHGSPSAPMPEEGCSETAVDTEDLPSRQVANTPFSVAEDYCLENQLSCDISKLYEGTVAFENDEMFGSATFHGAILDLGVDSRWLIAGERNGVWFADLTTTEGCENGTDQPNLVEYCRSL